MGVRAGAGPGRQGQVWDPAFGIVKLLVKSLCSLELGQRGRWRQQGCEARPHILLLPPCCLPDTSG